MGSEEKAFEEKGVPMSHLTDVRDALVEFINEQGVPSDVTCSDLTAFDISLNATQIRRVGRRTPTIDLPKGETARYYDGEWNVQPPPCTKKPPHRDLQAVLESILHASQGRGAARQQHARAIGFVHGFWPNGFVPPDMDSYETRAYQTGKRVGQWVDSLMPEGFAR